MVNRILVGGFAAALAGAAMLAISSAPASAFTLTSPSLEPPVAAPMSNMSGGTRLGLLAPAAVGATASGWGPVGIRTTCWAGRFGSLTQW